MLKAISAAVSVFVILALTMAAPPSFADRAAYGGTRDIVASSEALVVRHHHDWSRIPTKDDAWVLRYSPATPFGVDEEISNLEFYSPEGALVARVPSPPLTHLEISADGRYVIGLSKIRLLNNTQLLVLNSKGELLLRRRISSHLFCFSAREYEELKWKHQEAFAELDRDAKLSYDSYGWREGDRVYLDIRSRVAAPYWAPFWGDLVQAMCDSPLSANFGQSVTNWTFWYHDTPRPRVVEKDGRPFEVRLRDPKGIEFSVKFEQKPLETVEIERAN